MNGPQQTNKKLYNNSTLIQANHLFYINEPNPNKESDLTQRWLSLKPGTLLMARCGRTISVMNPGQLNMTDGPDISQATIIIDDEIKTGKIECHTKEGNWRKHRHNHDPAYDDIILHVVNQFAAKPVLRQVPTVALVIKQPMGCKLTTENLVKDVLETIAALGQESWDDMVRQYYNKLLLDFQHQALRYLGKGGNEIAFKTLSELIGFVDISITKRSELIRILSTLIKDERIIFHRAGIRPANHASNRLDFAARIMLFIREWNVSYFWDIRKFELIYQERIAGGCGKAMTAELLGNAFYPFLASRSRQHGHHGKDRQWYKQWSALQLPLIYGKIKRQFSGLLYPGDVKKFPISQGILRLQRSNCRYLHCESCPLSSSGN
ncbi:MAG TPA: DUF2851 family protein [Candidatus Marinimicrobia bacterium]|nr:DUF2851 family protein [Candidatus Neomarinimicrobiota bacterium]